MESFSLLRSGRGGGGGCTLRLLLLHGEGRAASPRETVLCSTKLSRVLVTAAEILVVSSPEHRQERLVVSKEGMIGVIALYVRRCHGLKESGTRLWMLLC